MRARKEFLPGDKLVVTFNDGRTISYYLTQTHKRNGELDKYFLVGNNIYHMDKPERLGVVKNFEYERDQRIWTIISTF